MEPAEDIAEKIERHQRQLKQLLNCRNEMIQGCYRVEYNISNWHKVKVGYVYQKLATEFNLSVNSIRKIIGKQK